VIVETERARSQSTIDRTNSRDLMTATLTEDPEALAPSDPQSSAINARFLLLFKAAADQPAEMDHVVSDDRPAEMIAVAGRIALVENQVHDRWSEAH
jgi:hypothetical protein